MTTKKSTKKKVVKKPVKKKAVKKIVAPVLSPKEKAFAAFQERLANPPTPIDNASLYAGSPMYFYCILCGGISDILSEDYMGSPRKICADCQELKDNGWTF